MTDHTPNQASVPAPPVRWEAPPAPTPPNVPRSAGTRSRLAILGVAISGVLGAMAFLQDVNGIGVIDRLAAGELGIDEAEAFDATFAAMGLLQAGALILSGIAFLGWLSRSVDNVPGLGGGKPVVTAAWSIVWWFIPFANLVMPFRIVADLHRRMAPAPVGVGLILIWWVLWLVSNIVSLVAGAAWTNASEFDELRAALGTYAISDILDPITAALVILIVVRVQRWADARAAAPTPAPASMSPMSPTSPAPPTAAETLAPDTTSPAASGGAVSWGAPGEPETEAPRVDTGDRRG